MSRPIKTVATTFLRRTNFEMNKPIKILSKELEGIIEKLLLLASSKDEKIALGAMKTLLDYYADAVEMKNRDEITRLIAQTRSGSGLLGGSIVGVGGRNTPLINFSEIQEV